MNRQSPYAGYSGLPPRPNYGGPSHQLPQPPHHVGGMNAGFNGGPYGMPSGPPPYVHGPPPPMMGQPPPGAYGGDPYRPPMPAGPMSPPNPGVGAFNGNLSAFGSPVQFNAGPPAGGRPPPPGPMNRAGSGPQKRSFDDRGSGSPYGNGGGQSGPPAVNSQNGQQQRKRSRVGDNGVVASEEGPVGEQSYAEYLEERLARERPCRTLFVRNIDFTTSVATLRGQFESFGEIKTWFDLIQKRGIAFVTYFDLRAAEAARKALHGARFGVRDLDVHFSLPRESEMSKRCDRDKDQGTLFIVLKQAPDDLNDAEIANLFAPFGEIKNLRPYKDQNNCRFIEFWDCRATKAAHDAIINSSYRGGVWDVKFAWDQGVQERLPDMVKHDRDRERLNRMANKQGGDGGGQRHRPAGPVGDRGPGHAGDGGNNMGQAPVMRRWGQAQGVVAPSQPQPQPPPPMHGPGVGSPSGPQHRVASAYGPPPSARPPPSGPKGHPPAGAGDANRLEQAQKVQQLLASLKPTTTGGFGSSPATGTTAPAPAAQPPAPSLPSNIAALLQLAQSKAAGSSR